MRGVFNNKIDVYIFRNNDFLVNLNLFDYQLFCLLGSLRSGPCGSWAVRGFDAHPSHVNPTGDGADEEPAPQPPCETEAPGNPLGVSPAEPAVGVRQ